MQDLTDFLTPINLDLLNNDEGYVEGQIGKHIAAFTEELPDLEETDIVFVGITENRGEGNGYAENEAANLIRKHFYKLYYWHTDVKLADLGNIKVGAKLKDSYAAITSVLEELKALNKTVVLIGGSHDISLAQYKSYFKTESFIEVTCIDALIDLQTDTPTASKNFLMELLTSEPNIINHYNHVAFQSYLVHPYMLETIDKLRFDCYRVGQVAENIEEMEPVFRQSHMVSFDVSAIKYSDAPANKLCPNGLTGIDACMLTRYAGMSPATSTFGVYGYQPQQDTEELTAAQISQMLWYFIDGKSRSKEEKHIEERQFYNEFHTIFAEVDTLFLQSKRTGRWWMQMPDKTFIACSKEDYSRACHNEIPERWLRIQERN